MNFFTFDLKKVIIIVILLTLPLISVNMKNDPQHPAWYTRPFSFFAGVAQNIYSNFSNTIIDTTSVYVDLVNIKKMNRMLISENSYLRTTYGMVKELELENARLNSMLGFQAQSGMDLLAAQIIASDLMTDHATLTINRGTRDGLKPGQAVITTEGVLGYIFRPEVFTSQILLITDRYAVVDAIVQRTRARGLIEGKTKELSQMRYLERLDDVSAGDLIVTSGSDENFPKGFAIGVVTDVQKKSYEASLRVTVRPYVDSEKVEEVFVVLNANNHKNPIKTPSEEVK